MVKENNIPSTSPKNPTANMLDVVETLMRLTQVNDLTNAAVERVTEDLFSFLFTYGDQKVLNGEIKKEDAPDDIKQYVPSLNRLFKLAKNDEVITGARIQLSWDVVKEYDIRAAAMMKCLDDRGMGGDMFDVICEVVNSVKEELTPSTALTGFKATGLSPAENIHDHQ